MTQLRDRYVEALIENVKQGALAAELLDRIERLLSTEHGATAPAPPTETPSSELEPTPPHEESQETGIAARPPLDALSAPDKESPAPSPVNEDPGQDEEADFTPPPTLAADPPAPASPERRRRGRPAAPMPRCQDCDAELTNRNATRCKSCSNKARAGSPSPRASTTMRQVWQERRQSDGTPPETEGGTPIVSVHVSPDASEETLEALASVAEKAVALVESGELTRIVKVKSGRIEELPSCTCIHQFAVDGPGHWHDGDCPRHRHKWSLPPAAGLDGLVHPMKCACGATKDYDPGESMYNGHPVQSKKHSAVVTS